MSPSGSLLSFESWATHSDTDDSLSDASSTNIWGLEVTSIASLELGETHGTANGSSDSSVTDTIDNNEHSSLALARDIARLKRVDSPEPALHSSHAFSRPAIK